jgi:N-acetylglucosaminyldiphosphoundecaprenol N-acetyl-beta-D-mannosaminyltransferase
MVETVALCWDWCDEPVRTAHHLATVNVANLIARDQDPELWHAYDRADLIVADGVPILWASQLLGRPLPDRVAGVELMEELIADGARSGRRFFFLGARQEVLDKLTERLVEAHPDLEIAGARNGFFDGAEEASIIQQIRESNADVLFIGMPTPFKEIWAELHRDQLGVPVILGVGGSFDVLAGVVARAPIQMQKLGLEWTWRLLKEPRKMWKRYLFTNTRFLAQLSLAMLRRAAGRNV